jgi:lysozyme
MKKLTAVLVAVVLLLSAVQITAFASTSGNYVVNTSVGLTVRSGAGTNYGILGYLSYGTKITVLETKSVNNMNWGRIIYNGKEGWVCIYYCIKETETIKTETVPTYDDIPDEYKVNRTIVDISSFNATSSFDWNKLKASGVDGVIIRVGGTGTNKYKKIYSDNSFLTHYKNAKAAGLEVGAYFFSYALTQEKALEEAQFTINVLKNNNCELTLPVFIDIEDYESDTQHRKAGTAVCNTVVNTFCDTVKAAGYFPGIYCSLDYTRTVLSASVFEGRAVWIAHWANECSYTGEYHLWQYTENGTVTGYSGKIDVSKCYVDFPSLIAKGILTTNVSEATTYTVSDEMISFIGRDTINVGDTLTAAQRLVLLSPTDKITPLTTYTFEDIYESTGGIKLTYRTDNYTVLTAEYSYGGDCKHEKTTTVTKTATGTGYGTTSVICEVCKKTISAKLTALPTEHNMKETVKVSTDTEIVTITNTCTTCGKTTTVSAKYGDIDDSGKIDVADARLALRAAVKLDTFTDKQTAAADVNFDKKVNVDDARYILRIAVKLDSTENLIKTLYK